MFRFSVSAGNQNRKNSKNLGEFAFFFEYRKRFLKKICKIVHKTANAARRKTSLHPQ